MKKRAAPPDWLPPARRSFVKLNVCYWRRASSEEEFLRFLVANAIRDWEKVNGHAFDYTVFRHCIK